MERGWLGKWRRKKDERGKRMTDREKATGRQGGRKIRRERERERERGGRDDEMRERGEGEG